MAVSISFALSYSSIRSLSTISPLRLPPSLHSHKPVLVLRNPSSRSLVASMSVEAPKRSPDASFLDRKESTLLHFVKYQGLGNDFIMVDNRDSLEPKVTPEQAVKLCNRNFGIGADGVIFAMPGVNGTDYSMRIFNSDGSEPEVIRLLENLYLFHTESISFMAVDKSFSQLGDVLMVGKSNSMERYKIYKQNRRFHVPTSFLLFFFLSVYIVY